MSDNIRTRTSAPSEDRDTRNETTSSPLPDGTLEQSPADAARVLSEAAPSGVPGYEILSELGKGAMGVVYKARDVRLHRIVALKRVLGATVQRAELLRFLAEAEAVATVRHENVVQIHEYGEAGGLPYMALEYLPGGTLADLLPKGSEEVGSTVSARDGARLLTQIARGVAAVHAQGIVHRDLKPKNVLLDEKGTPKVADFGIAKRNEGSGLTQTGDSIGTPAYMSPEQASGKAKFVGPPADVWALGVILYEWLTGTWPFAGESHWEIMTRICGDDPVPPRKLVPAVPHDLNLICLKCLSKAPHERYPTAKELADDLDRFTRGEPISVRPAGPIERGYKWVRRNKTVAGATAAVCLALVVGSVVSLWQADRAKANAREADAAARLADERKELAEQKEGEARTALNNEIAARAQLNVALGNETAARASEKAATVQQARNLYTAHMNLVQRAWERSNLQHARELLEQHIPEDEHAPDFRGFEWYYFWRLTHAATPVLTDLGHIRSMAASPDNKRLVLASSGAWVVWDTSGKAKPVRINVGQDISCVAWSADGKWLAAGSSRAGQPGVVYLVDATTLKVRHELKGHTTRLFALAFTPDSRTLISASTDLGDGAGGSKYRDYAIHTSLRLPGEVRFWDVAQPGEGTAAEFGRDGGLALSVSPNGRWLAVGRSDGGIQLVDLPERKVVSLLGRHRFPIWSVAVADDGRVAAGGGEWDEAELILWSRSRPVGFLLGVATTTLADGISINSVLPGSLAQKVDLRANDLIVRFNDIDLAKTPHDLRALLAEARHTEVITLRVRRNKEELTIKVPVPETEHSPASHEPVSLVGHTGAVRGVRFTPDHTKLITVSEDRTVRTWDARSGHSLGVYRGHNDAIWALSVMSDGHTLFTGGGGSDRSVFAWDLRQPQEYIAVPAGTASGHDGLIASPVDHSFILNTAPNAVQIDSRTGEILQRLAPLHWRYNSDGELYLTVWRTSPKDPMLRLWIVPKPLIRDPSSWPTVSAQLDEWAAQKPAERPIQPALEFDPSPTQFPRISVAYAANNSRTLFVPTVRFHSSKELWIWNLNTKKRETIPVDLVGTDYVFSPAGRYLAASFWSGVSDLRVWDMQTGKRVLNIDMRSAVAGIRFSRSEKWLAAAPHDGKIRVFETSEMKLFREYRTQALGIYGLQFSRDEKVLLASNFDGRVRLWDIESGEERLVLRGPSGASWAVEMSADGRTVMACYDDGHVVIWRAAKDGEAPKYRKK